MPFNHITIFALLLTLGISVYAIESKKWSYSGPQGADFWGTLHSELELCTTGKNQSPINLSRFTDARLSPIEFSYHTQPNKIHNNGLTILASFNVGSTISVDDHKFELKHIHFHTPSENHINGQSFAMEGHLVHADNKGNLAVISVMFEQGMSNDAVEKLWKNIPETTAVEDDLLLEITGSSFLPADKDYYRFNGSLTTPPCTEGVIWLVMKHHLSVSKSQIKVFSDIFRHPNNRPLQPINARLLLQ